MPRGKDDHHVNLMVTQLESPQTKEFFPKNEIQTRLDAFSF